MFQISPHRRCRPTGDETSVAAVIECRGAIGTEVNHFLGAKNLFLPNGRLWEALRPVYFADRVY